MSARTLSILLVLALVVACLCLVRSGMHTTLVSRYDGCWPGTRALVLAGQSVPTAASVPCLPDGPGIWRPTSVESTNDGTRYVLAIAGGTTWSIRLDADCASDAGADHVDEYPFPGGCVTSAVDAGDGVDVASLAAWTRTALDLVPVPNRDESGGM